MGQKLKVNTGTGIRATPGRLHVQTQQKPSFEVVSIKLNTDDSHNYIWGCRGTDTKVVNSPFPLGRCVGTHTPVQFVIADAYDVPSEQILSAITGGPGWMLSTFYDIQAKAERPTTEVELQRMVRTMLEDRFKLKLHYEDKEVPSFALVVAKSGAKLRVAAPDEESKLTMQKGEPMTGTRTTMASLAKHLAGMLGRSVKDKTGLNGVFDFTLNLNQDSSAPEFLFTALQEQLGLKLESDKAIIERHLVIDHIEKPTVN